MRSDGVVLIDPISNDSPGVLEGGEAMEPDALFLEGADEALAEAVLFGSVGSDILLFETIAAHGAAVEARAKDEAVVVTQSQPGRGAVEPAKAINQGSFQGSLGGFGASGIVELPAEDLAGAAVDDRNHGAPAIGAAVHESDVGCPALIGSLGDGTGGLGARTLAGPAGLECPALEPHDALHLLAVDEEPIDEAQQRMPKAACVSINSLMRFSRTGSIIRRGVFSLAM